MWCCGKWGHACTRGRVTSSNSTSHSSLRKIYFDGYGWVLNCWGLLQKLLFSNFVEFFLSSVDLALAKPLPNVQKKRSTKIFLPSKIRSSELCRGWHSVKLLPSVFCGLCRVAKHSQISQVRWWASNDRPMSIVYRLVQACSQKRFYAQASHGYQSYVIASDLSGEYLHARSTARGPAHLCYLAACSLVGLFGWCDDKATSIRPRCVFDAVWAYGAKNAC